MMRAMKLLPVLLCLLLVGCSGSKAEQKIDGTFTLSDPIRGAGIGDSCQGSGGYSDINSGSTVTVKDEAGKIIGTAQLGGGRSAKPSTSVSYSVCKFGFTVDKLPRAKFYAIEVGRRGALTYSFDEMKERGWNVAITLGGD